MGERLSKANIEEMVMKKKLADASKRAAAEAQEQDEEDGSDGAEEVPQQSEVIVPEAMKDALMQAREDGELLSATMQVVQRLSKKQELAGTLGKLTKCIQIGFEDGLKSNIGLLCGLLYGKTRQSNELRDRIVAALLEYQETICGMLGIPVETAYVKPEETPAPKPARARPPAPAARPAASVAPVVQSAPVIRKPKPRPAPIAPAEEVIVVPMAAKKPLALTVVEREPEQPTEEPEQSAEGFEAGDVNENQEEPGAEPVESEEGADPAVDEEGAEPVEQEEGAEPTEQEEGAEPTEEGSEESPVA